MFQTFQFLFRFIKKMIKQQIINFFSKKSSKNASFWALIVFHINWKQNKTIIIHVKLYTFRNTPINFYMCLINWQANQSKKQSFNHFQHNLDRFDMILFSGMKKFFKIIIFYFGLKIWLIFSNFFFEIDFLFHIFHIYYPFCYVIFLFRINTVKTR